MVLPSSETLPAERRIQEGDLVIVYESYTNIKAVYVNSKEKIHNRYGTFLHKDWIGQPFGSKVTARAPSSGWLILLAPTAELWTQVLRHRTQILYIADISLVVANLGLCPGKVVLESGTGSGSLTHSLARAVAPSGHVFTFDFHELRAQEAKEEFKRHGLAGLVTVQQRNIEEDGFPAALAGKAEALFLDLPGPWKAVASAAACLKPGGNFCSFSPCIEQVQHTCQELDRQGFVGIRTLEILLRTYDVTMETLQTSTTRAKMPNKQNKKRSRTAADAAGQAADSEDEGAVRQVMAQPVMEARGHTGFLTFARKFVAAVPLSDVDYGDEEEDEEAEEGGEDGADDEGGQQAGAAGDRPSDAGTSVADAERVQSTAVPAAAQAAGTAVAAAAAAQSPAVAPAPATAAAALAQDDLECLYGIDDAGS